jgi:hypothetical protein
MSCLQFWTYYRQTQAKTVLQQQAVEKTNDPGAIKDIMQTIKVNMQGVEVSTPVMGVIILTLSLAFFYFYLHLVFPIQ